MKERLGAWNGSINTSYEIINIKWSINEKYIWYNLRMI